MTQFVVPAITTAGKIGKVSVATFNGTPFVLKYMQDGDIVRMVVGESLDWIGYAFMDTDARLLAGMGLPVIFDAKIPLRIFTKDNVDEAGSPPAVSTGYVIEDNRVPGAVASPRHRDDDHPMLGAGHPRRIGLQKRPEQPQVQRPPLPSTFALVIARRPPSADPAPPRGDLARPHVGHQHLLLAVELDPLHHGPLDPEQPSPYRVLAHAVPRSLVPDLQTAQNLCGDGVLLTHPVN